MKQKKNLMVLLLIAIIGIVGVTIAYFSSTTAFENVFETSEYGTTYTESFVSPDNWLPGDTTNKTVIVTNSGTVDEAVRVKVEESWISKNGTTLPLTQGDNVAADIHWINEDDWTKVTVDGEDYYYYYYNYKLAPGETTSKLLDKVTFNPLINATTSCTETVEDGILTRTCNSSGAGYDGATYTLKFTIETVQYNKYQDAWNTGSTITLLDEKPYPLTVQEFIESATNPSTITSYNDTSADKGKMFQFSHTINNKTVNETRYIGNEPKNYVKFNCDNDGNNCETWRILGVFDVEREIDDEENPGEKKTITEQRMKLVRGYALANTMIFNSNLNNDWTVSTLNTFLNGDYYNRIGDAVTYGLKASAQGMIDNAVYYLGALSWNSTNSNWGTTEKIYGEERGTTLCGACNSDTTKLTWTGIVGLMYPSDEYMVYGNGVNATCYDNPYGCGGTNAQTGWVYKSNILEGQSSPYYTWLLSSYAGGSNGVLGAYGVGSLDNYVSRNSFVVRPVVYLKSNIKIAGGTGEAGSPYTLAY